MKFKTNGFELFYEDLGSREGDVVVFLNGVMASTSSWYVLSELFVQKGYRVILHDFKGQLKSDKPSGPYTFLEHARETIELLKHLNVSKAHFIGTSYGGEVALKIGILFPTYVKSLAIINSVSETDALLEAHINHWINLAKRKDGYAFFWGMAPSIYGPKFLNEQHQFLEERAVATNSVNPSYFDGQVTLYETFRDDVYMTDKLHQITAPTLVICTTHDILKPIKFSKIIADKIKGSEFVVIQESGHVTIFEAPNELKSLLLGFILKQN